MWNKKQEDKAVQLGNQIHQLRKLSGMTQEQLAEMVNVDRTHIGNLELARRGVSLDVIFYVADALEVPVCKLFEFRD